MSRSGEKIKYRYRIDEVPSEQKSESWGYDTVAKLYGVPQISPTHYSRAVTAV